MKKNKLAPKLNPNKRLNFFSPFINWIEDIEIASESLTSPIAEFMFNDRAFRISRASVPNLLTRLTTKKSK